MNKLICWLRECYQADRSRIGVKNFYRSSIRHQKTIRGREKLANDELPSEALPPSYSGKLSPYLRLYRREKELIYGTLFLCGQFDGKPVLAPLLLYPAKLIEPDDTILEIDTGSWRLNPAVTQILETQPQLEKQMTTCLEAGALNDLNVGKIRTLLAQKADTSHLLQWPHLHSKKSANNLSKQNQLTLIPFSALGVIDRSKNARGVIDELTLLSEQKENEYSAPLRFLYGSGSPAAPSSQNSAELRIPASLSRAQEQILKSARHSPLTVCHGPPGTGKSFTLSTIIADHLYRNESVLVVSRGQHALDALEESLHRLLGSEDIAIRGGTGKGLTKLKDFLEAYLKGQLTTETPPQTTLNQLNKEFLSCCKDISIRESLLEKHFSKASGRGDLLAYPAPSLWMRFKLWRLRKKTARTPLLMKQLSLINQLRDQKEILTHTLFKIARKIDLDSFILYPPDRDQIKNLLAALRKRRGTEQETAFKKINLQTILKALPVWMAEADDLHRILPLNKESFDLLVIDEASQCDLASFIPALQRAKRVVIAGDQKQLRHVCFLAKDFLRNSANEVGVPAEQQNTYNYRNTSLMDLAVKSTHRQSQVAFLNEHFRGLEPLIRFNNQHFYRNQLHLMRHRKWEDQPDCLSLIKTNGTRNDNGVNEEEIHSIISQLKIITRETSVTAPTIGILSPFRHQIDAIYETLTLEENRELFHTLQNQHELAIGTAHSFQGRERDIMLISFTLGPSYSHGSLRFLEKEDVFNVATSRAKNKQLLFTSLAAQDLPNHSLLGQYLAAAELDTTNNDLTKKISDPFSQNVTTALKKNDWLTKPNTEIAGIGIDLLIQKPDQPWMGIDFIGYPGATSVIIDQTTSRILQRANLTLLPLCYSEWKTDPQRCLETLEQLYHESSNHERHYS